MSCPLRRAAQPGVQADFYALPRDAAVRAMEVFVDVAQDDVRGQPLGERPSVGDLADCFTVYFDTDPGIKPRYRLVYRLLPPGGVEIVTAELVAVGLRARLDAYLRAARRLERLAEDDA